jgi:hypothetical protein
MAQERESHGLPARPGIETVCLLVKGTRTSGLTAVDGRITRAAPLFRRFIGSALTGVIVDLKAQGWTVLSKTGTNPRIKIRRWLSGK